MAVHDPVADMLTVIRNGVRAQKTAVNVKRSRLNLAILEVLRSERYLFAVKPTGEEPTSEIRVYLKAPEGSPARVRILRGIQRMSKPGLRHYVSGDKIPLVLNGMGMCVLSTSQGLMTGFKARKSRLGGEVLLKVW